MQLSESETLFEFVAPMFPENWLNEDWIEEYRIEMSKNVQPTAIALSIFDVHEPADFEDNKEITSHWCLSHYLIDGHHKIHAAHLENKPITLLSFLIFDQSLCDDAELERLRAALTP